MASAPFRVFYSYSHADIKRLEQLRKHLAMLRRDGMITEWYDRDIEAGSEWRQEIERELDAADVILLLVSASFLNSDFCYSEEMNRAVERARNGEARVIGVMLSPVDGWESSPFAEFQLVPRDGRPITTWSNKDAAYADVAHGIRTALEELARSTDAGEDAGLDEEPLSPTELALLDRSSDPEQRSAQRLQMILQKQAMLDTTLDNIAQMREDMLKAVRQNLRADSTEPDS
jgi:hypothetical protein